MSASAHEKKPGTFRSRRVEQGGFTSGRRRWDDDEVKSWGPFQALRLKLRPGRSPGKQDRGEAPANGAIQNRLTKPVGDCARSRPDLDRWTHFARFSSNSAQGWVRVQCKTARSALYICL